MYERFKTADGYYEYEGLHHDDLESLVWTGILGFCGCGPYDKHEIVLKGLEHIHKLSTHEFAPEEWDAFYSAWSQDGKAIFGNYQSEYFFYYWADSKQLTEHGGAIPGWLTEDGRELLAALREIASGLEDGGPDVKQQSQREQG